MTDRENPETQGQPLIPAGNATNNPPQQPSPMMDPTRNPPTQSQSDPTAINLPTPPTTAHAAKITIPTNINQPMPPRLDEL